MIPMYRLRLHGLYGLYGPRCPLSPERLLDLITHSPSVSKMDPREFRLSFSVISYPLVKCWNGNDLGRDEKGINSFW